MPDIFLFIISIVFFIILTIASFVEKKECFIGSIVCLLLFSWVVLAHKNAEKYLQLTTKVVVVDNTAYIKYENRMINLNRMFDKNIQDNKEVKVYKYQNWKYGIYFLENPPIIEISD